MTTASPKSHIFISYARKDSKVADDLQTRLRQRGIEVWVDRSRLVPGAAWPEGLRRAVEGCDAMLVLLSPASLASEFVRREYLHALSLGKVIIPVVIGKVEAFPEELRDVQWIDLTQQSGQGYYDLLLALDAHGLML
ncbi:MAG TPA: toll/interleukin-1 receptor domain-containing protein, partial [Ktedonobacterales bacterium]